MGLHFLQVFMYKFLLAMHGNSGSVINSIATFQDNESCHFLMKKKQTKRLSRGFHGYSILLSLRLIQMLMHSLSSFKCGSGLDKVISDCCIWVQEFCIECSGTICGNHLWISVTPQGMPVLRMVLLLFFEMTLMFSWQHHKNSRDLWWSWRGRQPGPSREWAFVRSRWYAAFLIWPCFILWA